MKTSHLLVIVLKILTALAFVTSYLFGIAYAETADKKPLKVSIVPQFPTVEIYNSWSPFIKKLGEKTGLEFELMIKPNIPEFEASLYDGEADFAFMNPYHMVIANRKQHYIPLVRDSESLLTGMIFVRADSPIQSIKELDNQTIAFPAPNAYGASLLIRAALKKNNIHIQPLYVKTHSNVYRYILFNDVVAGGGINNTFQRESEDIKNALRLLYETSASAPHPFASHPRVPKPILDRVQRAIIDLSGQLENEAIFTGIQMKKPIMADYSRDYQPLETLGLDDIANEKND